MLNGANFILLYKKVIFFSNKKTHIKYHGPFTLYVGFVRNYLPRPKLISNHCIGCTKMKNKVKLSVIMLNLTGVFWIIDWLNWNNYNSGKNLNGTMQKWCVKVLHQNGVKKKKFGQTRIPLNLTVHKRLFLADETQAYRSSATHSRTSIFFLRNT